ncbi:MAG: helix-turn-helix domain-containing protein [Bacteriovoracaceae bacterium]|nr:helix-turn-helix domain-containing protein [Bacteriovoracaceae bacterium]
MTEIQIGKVLKHYLKAKKLNLKLVSQSTKIPYSTLYSWQENRPPKDIVKAKRLADFLGVTIDELIFDRKHIDAHANLSSAFTSENNLTQQDQKYVLEVVVTKISKGQ